MKKGTILVSNAMGTITRIQLVTRVTKAGRATVKVLDSGILPVREGATLKGFELTHGAVKLYDEMFSPNGWQIES